jgi:hypothetical protein
MTDLDPATCPRCGDPILAVGPAGLCPRCLASGTQAGQSQDAAVSPSAPQGARRKRWLAPATAVIGAILSGGLWLGNAWRRQSDAMGRQSDAMAHYGRGVALADQGRPDEAISPNSARRSGSCPTGPRPTTTLATC